MRFPILFTVLISITVFSVKSQKDENGISTRSGVLVDKIFDFIMENIRHNAHAFKNYTTVPIPNLVKQFEANLGITKATASLIASKGTLSDLTTLHRVGDVTMRTEGKTAYFQASVALDVMRVVFKHYTLQAAFIQKSGDMLALDVGRNSFDAFLVARFDGLQCHLVLEKIEIKTLADVKVNITGFSILNGIGKKIAEWFIDAFNEFITDIAESYAKKMVNHVLKNTQICKKIFGSAISGILGTDDKSDTDQKHPVTESKPKVNEVRAQSASENPFEQTTKKDKVIDFINKPRIPELSGKNKSVILYPQEGELRAMEEGNRAQGGEYRLPLERNRVRGGGIRVPGGRYRAEGNMASPHYQEHVNPISLYPDNKIPTFEEFANVNNL